MFLVIAKRERKKCDKMASSSRSSSSLREDKEDVNVKLLKQLIPFILNASHYMTDLVYTLYYIIKLKEDSEDVENLTGYMDQLRDEIYKLRANFRNLLNKSSGSIYGTIHNDDDTISSSEEETKKVINDATEEEEEYDGCETIKFFRNLLDIELLNLVKDINDTFDEESSEIDTKLRIQIRNCLIGFINLVNFIKKIPIKPRDKYSNDDDRESMESIINVISDELLLSWKIELDLLNCKIFNLISKNEKVLALFNKYQEENRVKQHTEEDSETFIKLISWLKDDQVFPQVVL